MYIDSESELRKIGSQAKKFVLKDFAGKFGALFFGGFGYKIDAPIFSRVAIKIETPMWTCKSVD